MSDWQTLGLISPSSRDLCNEMERAARAFSFAAAQALIDLGVPGRDLMALTGAGEIGRARAEIDSAGLYQPNGISGLPVIILPIMESGDLVDLLAFSPRAPDSWALRRGAARLLGAGNIPRDADWQSGERQVQIFANPLEWLIAGGSGICVLAWDARAVRELAALGPDLALIADSAALAAYIDQQMAAVQMLPRVTFDNSLTWEAAA